MPKSRISHPAVSGLKKQRNEQYDLLSYAAEERIEVESEICYAQKYKHRKREDILFCSLRSIIEEQKDLTLQLIGIKAALCLSKAILADYPESTNAQLSERVTVSASHMDSDTEEVLQELIDDVDAEFEMGSITVASVRHAVFLAIKELQANSIDDDELAL